MCREKSRHTRPSNGATQHSPSQGRACSPTSSSSTTEGPAAPSPAAALMTDTADCKKVFRGASAPSSGANAFSISAIVS
jgi:hypothetical protein